MDSLRWLNHSGGNTWQLYLARNVFLAPNSMSLVVRIAKQSCSRDVRKFSDVSHEHKLHGTT